MAQEAVGDAMPSSTHPLIQEHDFEGQRLAELMSTVLLTTTGVRLPSAATLTPSSFLLCFLPSLPSALPVSFPRCYSSRKVGTDAHVRVLQFLAFFAGYISQNIHYTLWTLLGGSALTFVACVPPWPMFNQSPVRWLPAKTMPKGYVGAAGQGFDITVDGKKVQ
ncbi:hypothetical protein MBLNU459_g5308t1 [Dothideomycetes sp. NU459]